MQNIDFAETFPTMPVLRFPMTCRVRAWPGLLKGETPESWRKSLYYHYYEYPAVHSVRRHEGVSDGRFKLIRFYGTDVPDGEE